MREERRQMMELEGKAIEIEAGKTYAIEVEAHFNPDVARAYARMFEEETGAKFIFLAGGKLARSSEQELREIIAQEIEKWTEDFIDNSPQQFIVRLCADIARGKSRV